MGPSIVQWYLHLSAASGGEEDKHEMIAPTPRSLDGCIRLAQVSSCPDLVSSRR